MSKLHQPAKRAARLRRQAAAKREKAAKYTARAKVATDPRSESSLRAHATRALRDAGALEAKAARIEE